MRLVNIAETVLEIWSVSTIETDLLDMLLIILLKLWDVQEMYLVSISWSWLCVKRRNKALMFVFAHINVTEIRFLFLKL